MIPTASLCVLPVATASGLCADGELLYVVGDDQVHLDVLGDRGLTLRGTVRLVEGELPEEHAARKAAKPDFEALALLPGRRLVAIGSGSLAPRCRAAVVDLPASGVPEGPARSLDLAPLYAAVRAHFPELTIEGAAVSGSMLRLLQRGNGAAGRSGLVDLDLAGVLSAIARDEPWAPALIRRMIDVDLGRHQGVTLGFTDASPLPDGRIVFSAAAEATANTYDDGACLGSAIGVLDADGHVLFVELLDTTTKIEGVHATLAEDGGLDLLLVADADDPHVPSPLFAAHVPPRAGR